MKKWRRMIVSTVTVLVLCMGNWAMGEPVTGYSTYVRLLPGGKDKQKSNFDLIMSAQEEVSAIESDKRKREIKFDRPVDIHFLNSNYTMISFEVFYRPKENSRFSDNPSIFALLFEGTGRNGLSRYTSRYIKWIGATDIDEYKSSKINDFCGYFRRVGVEDCFPDPNGEKPEEKIVQVKPISTGPTSNKLNGDMISSGIVKEAFIDKAIARKKDVDAAVKKNSHRIDGFFAELKTAQDNSVHAVKQIQSVDKKITELSASIAQEPKKEPIQEITIPPYSDDLKELEDKLERQTGQIKDMNNKIAGLEALLKGLSRNGNTLVLTQANLQIVNGTGMTKGVNNGTGNLIVGYNQDESGEPIQLGSHQIISPEGEKTAIPSVSHEVVRTPEKKGLKGRCFIGSLWE